MNFQRDGHLQMSLQKGRVNYSPSSLAADDSAARPSRGSRASPRARQGDKLRIRPDSFADHFSQARQFFYSQTEPEQNHIVAAFTFELSKVETKAVRARMLGQLANVDPKIAQRVANGLGHRGSDSAAPHNIQGRADRPEAHRPRSASWPRRNRR